MSDTHGERSGSVIDTSLTELAFIFFFILLTVSAWKISVGIEELKASETQVKALEGEVEQLSESLSTASEILAVADQFNPEDLFNELTAGRKAIEQLDSILQEKKQLEQELAELSSIVGTERSKEELLKQLREHSELIKILEQYSEGSLSEPAQAITELLQQYSDAKGQNINLRNKLAAVGNGLDHPPCWADPETGSIQYVYDVIINEDSVEFKAGWPEQRAVQALSNHNITAVPGVYFTNAALWVRTRALFAESEKKKCRHFVRVYDHAESKAAFKKYLLGIENHFYKYLSSRKYI